MKLETKRLVLREYELSDFKDIYKILSDAELMKHYPAPYDEAKTKGWIEWNIKNYNKYGFGIWAVILKETGEFIGDCGITMQTINGKLLPEIGYHIGKDFQRKGFASEAALECIRVAFEIFNFPAVYSYMKYTNIPSYSVALKNGMKFIEEYPDPVNTKTRVYAITKEEWLKGK